MEVLSALNLGDFAQVFSKMGMFPVFDVAYYIVSIIYLKYEPGECVLHFLYFSQIKNVICNILCYYLGRLTLTKTFHLQKDSFTTQSKNIYLTQKFNI